MTLQTAVWQDVAQAFKPGLLSRPHISRSDRCPLRNAAVYDVNRLLCLGYPGSLSLDQVNHFVAEQEVVAELARPDDEIAEFSMSVKFCPSCQSWVGSYASGKQVSRNAYCVACADNPQPPDIKKPRLQPPRIGDRIIDRRSAGKLITQAKFNAVMQQGK